LPAILLWGTLMPLLQAGGNYALAPATAPNGGGDCVLLLCDDVMVGAVVLHWMLVLTLALGCFIVGKRRPLVQATLLEAPFSQAALRKVAACD
jgi:hypothetical protein